MTEHLTAKDWTPRERATLCFILKAGRVLLIEKKRGLGAGKVNAPGGRIEPGETTEACAAREVEEEVCVTPLGLELRAELRFEFLDGYSLQCFVYVANDFVGVPSETDEALPFWVSVEEIPFDRMWEDDRQWLPQVLAGAKLRAAFVFDGDRMLAEQITHVRELAADPQT